MDWLASWTPEHWFAAIAISGSVAGWITSNTVRAFTYRREQQQREWTRVYELLQILNNKDYQHGHWSQIAAVNELKTLTHNRKAIIRIAETARDYWSKSGANPVIVSELDRLIAGKP